jgi:DNA-directed RNA polymerase specialized sigma subunit
MAIALQYQDLTQSLNNETVAGILRELRALEAETEKLDFYISLLDKRKSRIIRLYYFDGKTLEQTIAETQAAKRTVIKYRAAALRELTDMYAFIDRVKGEKREAGDGK